MAGQEDIKSRKKEHFDKLEETQKEIEDLLGEDLRNKPTIPIDTEQLTAKSFWDEEKADAEAQTSALEEKDYLANDKKAEIKRLKEFRDKGIGIANRIRKVLGKEVRKNDVIAEIEQMEKEYEDPEKRLEELNKIAVRYLIGGKRTGAQTSALEEKDYLAKLIEVESELKQVVRTRKFNTPDLMLRISELENEYHANRKKAPAGHGKQPIEYFPDKIYAQSRFHWEEIYKVLEDRRINILAYTAFEEFEKASEKSEEAGSEPDFGTAHKHLSKAARLALDRSEDTYKWVQFIVDKCDKIRDLHEDGQEEQKKKAPIDNTEKDSLDTAINKEILKKPIDEAKAKQEPEIDTDFAYKQTGDSSYSRVLLTEEEKAKLSTLEDMPVIFVKSESPGMYKEAPDGKRVVDYDTLVKAESKELAEDMAAKKAIREGRKAKISEEPDKETIDKIVEEIPTNKKILSLLFPENRVDEKTIPHFARMLERVTSPGVIETLINAAFKAIDYDKTYSYQGTRLVSARYDESFSANKDETMFETSGIMLAYPLKYLILSDRDFSSKHYSEVLKIGLGLPTEDVEVGKVFRAILMEKKTDPSKYLLVKCIRGKENGKHILSFETNDKEYATSHKEHMNFNLEEEIEKAKPEAKKEEPKTTKSVEEYIEDAYKQDIKVEDVSAYVKGKGINLPDEALEALIENKFYDLETQEENQQSQGEIDYYEGNYEKALLYFLDEVRKNPADAESVFFAGESSRKLEEYNDAIEHYNACLEIPTASEELIAYAHERLGDCYDALKIYRLAIKEHDLSLE